MNRDKEPKQNDIKLITKLFSKSLNNFKNKILIKHMIKNIKKEKR